MVSSVEYTSAAWVPAHASNYIKLARGFLYTHVVIHCTDGRGNALPVAEMWQKPRHGSSAHFVIGQDGTIIQSVSICDGAYHAHRANRTSIGIEHCCRTPGELAKNDPGLPPSEIQLAASARLTAWLCSLGGLEVNRRTIVGHAELDPTTTHTGCPTSAGIDLDAYVERVRAAERKMA